MLIVVVALTGGTNGTRNSPLVCGVVVVDFCIFGDDAADNCCSCFIRAINDVVALDGVPVLLTACGFVVTGLMFTAASA